MGDGDRKKGEEEDDDDDGVIEEGEMIEEEDVFRRRPCPDADPDEDARIVLEEEELDDFDDAGIIRRWDGVSTAENEDEVCCDWEAAVAARASEKGE